MATPLMIKIAMHYHCCVGDYGRGQGNNNFDARAVQDALSYFVTAGLLREAANKDCCFEPTPALAVWVNALCAVPMPVQQWIIPGKAA